MNELVGVLARMRKMLRSMESDLGLVEMSGPELDVYLAAVDLSSDSGSFSTNLLQSHALTNGMARPTFFRALKKLVEDGKLVKSPGSSKGHYAVGHG